MDGHRADEPAARPLVLIVEGHEDTCALYALALSTMGFDVIPTFDGTEGYRQAFENRPDIIVTNLPMPDFDGWQFLRDLKLNPRTSRIPVVAVSAYVERSVRERAERDGFAAFFVKPCLPDHLAAGLRQVLDGNGHAHLEG